MYEKFIALALVLAATVEGQDCDPYYGECGTEDASAPVPNFPMDPEAFSFLELPEAAASFMMYVGFGVFDDMNNEALDAWIAGFDWENHSFAQPNYEVFTGFVGYFNEPLYGEVTTVCMYSEKFATENYYGIGVTGFENGKYT